MDKKHSTLSFFFLFPLSLFPSLSRALRVRATSLSLSLSLCTSNNQIGHENFTRVKLLIGSLVTDKIFNEESSLYIYRWSGTSLKQIDHLLASEIIHVQNGINRKLLFIIRFVTHPSRIHHRLILLELNCLFKFLRVDLII